MGSPGAAPRHLPSLKSLWDAPVDGLDLDTLADGTDAVFLALPEHAAAEVAPALIARGKRVFDLSGAFRLRDAGLRQRWYPQTGDRPDSVVYGLTERNRDLLRDSTFVACAGCNPTAAILALQPLLEAKLVGQPLIIDAKSGVSGAGKTPSERTHFSECHGSLSAYGVFNHRHGAEIEQLAGRQVTFTPHLVPIDRGILSTIYVRVPVGTTETAARRAVTRPLVLKIGGELIEDPGHLSVAVGAIARLHAATPLVVVHGGGKEIDAALRAAGLEKRQVDGLRITDDAALDVVVAVLAGAV